MVSLTLFTLIPTTIIAEEANTVQNSQVCEVSDQATFENSLTNDCTEF